MKQKIEVEGAIELKRAVDYLEQILRSIKEGSILVRYGDQHLKLTPGPVVQFEFEAKQEKDKQELSFELTWKDGLQAEEDFGLLLSSQEQEDPGQVRGAVETGKRNPILFRKFKV